MATPRSVFGEPQRRSTEPRSFNGLSTPPLVQSSMNGPFPGAPPGRVSAGATSVARSTARRSVPASYAYQSQSRSAPFSVHSRGVPIHEFARFRDFGHIVWSTYRQLRDIGSSFFYLCMLQTASTVFSVALTIASYIYFAFTDRNKALSLGMAWTVVGFVMLLPILGLLSWTFSRRERAHKLVARIKSTTMWIYLAHRDWVPPECLPDGHLAAVQQTLFNILGEMRGYLLPPRYYTTSFPYSGIRQKMMAIAQDRAKYMRRIVSNLKKLSQYSEPLRRAGLDCGGLCRMTELYAVLHETFEQLACIKEYRTPLPVRALTRFCACVVIPIFFAPFFVSITTSNGFNICFAILINMSIIALLNASVVMEDPFDNQGLDGVYIDEPLSECEQMINMDEDHELELAVHESLGGPLGMRASLLKTTDDSLPNTAPMTPHPALQDMKVGAAKLQPKAMELTSHEVVDVHVEDVSLAAENAARHKYTISHYSVEAQNNSGSDHSELGLDSCFVIPPASPDDAPNYDSVAMTEAAMAMHADDIEAAKDRSEIYEDAM